VVINKTVMSVEMFPGFYFLHPACITAPCVYPGMRCAFKRYLKRGPWNVMVTPCLERQQSFVVDGTVDSSSELPCGLTYIFKNNVILTATEPLPEGVIYQVLCSADVTIQMHGIDILRHKDALCVPVAVKPNLPPPPAKQRRVCAIQ
jgi:hypothetical protein